MPVSSEKNIANQLRSMTGFAQTVVHEHGFVLTVSLRSVNHRTLDLHLSLPDLLQRLEPAVRKEIAEFHPRGHLQLKVTLERETAAGPVVDEELLAKYIELFRRMGERYGLSLEGAMRVLPQLPGVIAVAGSGSVTEVPPQLAAAFLKALRQTLLDWDQMRATEGTVLEEDLRARAVRIAAVVERLDRLRQEMLPLAQRRLQERLQTWLGQDALDSARLTQEAASFAEHTDISEEVVRLKAHFKQFAGMLDGKPEIGKKLDFLLQEIQRELNTLMAKTTGLGESGLTMTELALDIKGEAEKLREQVQNVQ